METLTKTIPQIERSIKETTQEYRNGKDNMPDFSPEIFTPEVIAEQRKNYFENLNGKARKSFEEIASDIQSKKNILKYNINKLRFPVSSSAVGSDERLNAEVTRQRAEQLALNTTLDYNVIRYLKNELQNKNIDFLNYFADAVKLNTGLTTELKQEMNEVFEDVAKQTGLNDVQNEMNILNKYEEYLKTYDEVIDSPEVPAYKLQLGYIQQELKNLTGAEV